jgi:aldose 1-epimerase
MASLRCSLVFCHPWAVPLAAWLACGPLNTAESATPMNKTAIARVEKDSFATTADGITVDRYTLRNAHGMAVRLITYGATVTELLVPDRHGKIADVALGFDRLAQYETQSPYFGATAGRVAFRISQGTFSLDGTPYHLTINSPPHSLHGGIKGLSKVVWHAEPLPGDAPAVKFTHRSPDGDQGYPGNLDITVTYTLTGENELKIDYTATCDRPTPVNLTHHTYFNLNGAGSGTVLDHVLRLSASRYTLLDGKGIPSGRIALVAGTPLDFRSPMAIGARMKPGSPVAGGYDQSYLVDHTGPGLIQVATLLAPKSGRRLEVFSTEPALIVYTGNYLDGTLHGKGGAVYGKHAGACLETAHLPDSVNRPEFPSIILRPGQTYRQTCVYRFSTMTE